MKKMLNELVRYGKFAFALAFALCCFNASATAITPAEYFAKKVDFTIGGYSGTSTLANFPVLVKLSTSLVQNFDYSACGTNGANIRFIDADNNLLPFEIDTWNPSGESFIWVSVPSLSGTSTKITMCYDANGSACPSADGNVWTLANYKNVWHLTIGSGNTTPNAVGGDLTATVINPNTDCGAGTGLVGGGYHCQDNKVKAHGLEIPASNSFTPTTANTFTYTAWARQIGGNKISGAPDSTNYPNIQWGTWGNCGAIWHVGSTDGGAGTGIELNLEGASGDTYFGFRNSSTTTTNAKLSLQNIYDKEWHFVVVRYNGGAHTIWIDGVQRHSGNSTYTDPSASKAYLGARKSNSADCTWTGDLDEMRFRDAASSDDWLAAEYANVTSTSFMSNNGAKDIVDEPLALGWTAEPMSANGDTIRTEGDFVYGYAQKYGGNSTYTVHGVTFKALGDGGDFRDASKNPDISVSSDNNFDWSNSLGDEGVAGDYGEMLKSAFWDGNNNGDYTFTLKNLEAGKKYLVQVFAHRSGQSYHVTSPDSKVINVGGSGWTYGGSLVGVFTADGTGKYTFTLNYGTVFVMNAIQVRKLAGAQPVYEPGWTAEEMTAGGAGFRTDGTLLYAYSRAGTSVNGIPFTNISFTDLKLTTSAAPNVYISTVTGDKNSYGQEGQTGDFASMLANCWIWPSTQVQPVTITLKGLTEGKTYLVQLFAHRNNVDSTADVSKRKDMTFAVDEQVVKIGDKCDVNDNDDVVYLGGSLIGIIQPTASTYDIQVTYAGGYAASFPLNAIQVRELGDTPTPPEPTTYAFYIGETGYDTWAAAYGALATSGGTITLGQDATERLDAYFGKNFTIDLHGKKLTGNTGWCADTVTIIDNVGGGSFDTGNSVNFKECNLDLSKLDPDQIINKISANNQGDTTVVVFPASMTVDQCKAKIEKQVSGTRFVVNGDTYVWNGTAWVLDALQPAADAAANVSAIQAAINAAALESPAGTVVLGEGTFEINAALDLKGGVTLKGQGWDNTIIKQTAAARCVAITNGAKLEGVTLTGGQSSSGAGAGALVTDGTISWCCISNNHTTAGGTSGGGVSFTSGQGTIDHSIIVGNSITGGSWGGGIGGRYSTGTIQIDTCLVYGNEDKSGSGGGIGFQDCAAVVTVRNATVVANKCSNGNGHGLYFNDVSTGGKIVLVNDILTGNGDTECNTFIAKAYFDTTESKNCLISGTQTQYSDSIYKDANVRTLFADQTKVISTAPTFAGTGDYHLATGSAGIAAGATYTGIGEDLDHNAFAATPSIGCYEYDGVAPTPTTYAVTWSGAENATVSAKVDDVAITSGDSVEDGKSVVFTVTPNSGYEFATASDGWTKSGANLTKTVTVNGAAVTETVPDATLIVLEPSDPAIGSVSAAVSFANVTISLSGIALGTDDSGNPAAQCQLTYELSGAASKTGTGRAMSTLTSSTTSFKINNLDDGEYTCTVTLTTEHGKTATGSTSFTIVTSSSSDDDPVQEDWWSAAPMKADPSMIRNEGTTVFAYSRVNGEVNGVDFEKQDNPINTEYLSLNFIGTGGGTYDVADDNYENLLKSCWYFGNTLKTLSVTLNKLTVGKRYLVQIVSARNDANTNAELWVPESGDKTIKISSKGTGWEYGGTLVGGFTATSDSKTFTIQFISTSSDWSAINAIQLRELPATEVVEPTAGDATKTRQDIQAAIDRAAPVRGAVKLSEGTFEIDEQLYVTNGVTLKGQGWENTIVKQAVTAASTSVRTRVAMVDGGASIVGVTITGGKLGEDGSGSTFIEYGDNQGGGLYVIDGKVSFCRVVGNVASAKRSSGGGVAIRKGTIEHCIIANNSVPGTWSGGGGGISYPNNSSGLVLIDDCLIVSNTTACAENFQGGGGVCLAYVAKSITIRNTTIANNSATAGHGGGITYQSNAYVSCLSLVNTIIVDNTAAYGTDSQLDNGNTRITLNNSTWDNVSASCSNNIFANGTAALGANSISLPGSGDSLFVDAAHGNYHLGDASPAIGTGATYEGLEGNVDLDGKEFMNPPSIGCYEYNGTGLEPLDTAAENRQMIQNAIDAVAPVHGTVYLGEGLFEIDQQLYVTNGVTLQGQSRDKTIIKQTSQSGGYGTYNRCVTVAGGSKIVNLALTGGYMNGNQKGAGVLVEDGTVSWCCVTNNSNTGGNGGGIGIGYSEGSAKVRIDHTIVANNTSTANGGGIGVAPSLNSTKGWYLTLEIDTCLVTGNKANGAGAGICVINKATPDPDNDIVLVNADIRNTTVVGNQGTGAGSLGGGFYTTQKNTTLLNCVFTDNTIAGTGDSNVAFGNGVDSYIAEKAAYCFFGGATVAFGVNAKSESADGAIAFVDAENGDYHLSANSPAVSAGRVTAEGAVDLDKVAFAEIPSMGCYEYVTSVAAPTFNQPNGTKFDTSLQIRIKAADGTTVYYTTDGTVPSPTNGTKYVNPITISETTTLKARAFDGSGNASAITTALYRKGGADSADYYVSTTGSDYADGLTPETAFKTIAHAVEVAEEGHKVMILPGTFEIGETIVVDKAITVTGSGWDETIIQPTSGKKIRLVELDNGAKLEGVTLTGGQATYGAGALVTNGTISWSKLTNNKGIETGGKENGAAISFTGGQGQVDHCIISGNTGATNFGGIGIGGVNPIGDILIDTCLIYGNSTAASTGWGSAVGFKNLETTCTIRNCTITGNTHSIYGAVYREGGKGKITLINDIIAGNKNWGEVEANIRNIDTSSSKNCYFGLEAEVSGVSDSSFGGTQFTNVGDGDYHPSSGWTEVISCGKTYTGIGDTLDGSPFGNPPSIGCYEASAGFGKVTIDYPAKHQATATVQLLGLSDGVTSADVTFAYGTDPEHLCEPFVVTNGVGVDTDIVATLTGLEAGMEYFYVFEATENSGDAKKVTREGSFTTTDWDVLQFSSVKAVPHSTAAEASVTIMKLGLGATKADVYIQWGVNEAGLCAPVRISTSAGEKQTLTYPITGLSPNTTYLVRFTGENDIDDTAMREVYFTTTDVEHLTLGEPRVSGVGLTAAKVTVSVPTIGDGASSAAVTLKWAVAGSTETNSTTMSSAATRGVTLSQSISSLTSNSRYYYEIEAVSDAGETVKASGYFWTDDPAIQPGDFGESYTTPASGKVITYDADNAGNEDTLEPGAPYVTVDATNYGYVYTSTVTSPGQVYHFRDVDDFKYNASARIGDNYYLFVSDAVDASTAGDTVEVLRNNYAVEKTIKISTPLTIEGNGHVIKVAKPFTDNQGYIVSDPSPLLVVILCANGSDAKLNNMTVMGGGAYVNNYSYFISAICVGKDAGTSVSRNLEESNGILEMDHVTITRSQGGLNVAAETKCYMNACNIVRNARGCGGGFYNRGLVVMENSSLSENRSLLAGGGGAACENQGALFMNNCVILNNGSTEYGGAINMVGNTALGTSPLHVYCYMMNMTMAGNFTCNASNVGGGIGFHQTIEDTYMLNCILCNNYYYDKNKGTVSDSDLKIDTGNSYFLYSVYGNIVTGSKASTSTSVRTVNAIDEDVFKGYSSFIRVYEDTKQTACEISGPAITQAPDDKLARYAPLTEDDSAADWGNDGVYTYFDASGWRSWVNDGKDPQGIKMSYKTYGGEMTALGKCQPADEDHLVTTYYESAFDPNISEREIGVVGASGFGTYKKTYTLYLIEKPVHGGVSDNLTLNGSTYDEGAEVTVVATPDAKCTFLGWYNENDELVSTKSVYKLVMDSDKKLRASFSEPSETFIFYNILCEQQDTGDRHEHQSFPIEITKDWLAKTFPTICPGGEVKDQATKEALEAELNKPDTGNGLNHIWQDYVLGAMDPGDHEGRIWIRGEQNSDSGKLTFKMQEFTVTKDCGFNVRYRLANRNVAKGEEKYDRSSEYWTKTVGSFDESVTSDELQYRIIDMIFIPTGHVTSCEYVTTVNTAGVLKVDSNKKVEIISSPWVGFTPNANEQLDIKASDYVKSSCLSENDVVYIYDRAHSNYLAWVVKEGVWQQLDTYQIINGVVYKDDVPAEISNTNSLPRGMGAWLERSNVKSPIYLYGQVDPSPVTTSLEPGFNLVGNPYPYEFDASQLPPTEDEYGHTHTGMYGDHIVIPTGSDPINAWYDEAKDSWLWSSNYLVQATKPNGQPRYNPDGTPMMTIKTVYTTDGLTLPIGHGFWYNNTSGKAVDLNWLTENLVIEK